MPDCYQGNELIDLSLVDPDNRRPVDYALRLRLLDELAALPERPDDAMLREAFGDARVGRGKLYVTWRLLQLRRAREELFRTGAYAALRVVGEKARHVVAFARRHGREASITVVPRLVATLGAGVGTLPCGAGIWGDTRVELPFLAPDAIVLDTITGRERRLAGGALALSEILEAAPVAVLLA